MGTKTVGKCALIFSFFLIGCVGKMQPKFVVPKTQSAGTCEAQRAQTLSMQSPFLVAGSKTLKSDFETLEPSAATGTFPIKENNLTFDAGFTLNVLVNRECINSSHSVFSQQVSKQVRRTFVKDKSSAEQSVTYKLTEKMSWDQLVAFFEREECVVGVSPERKLQALSLPNDVKYGEQNSLKAIHHDLAWPKISGLKQDVVVAVVDSGTDLSHPDLAPTIWNNPKEIPGNGKDDDNNGYVDDIHGYNNCYLNANVQGTWQVEHGEHIHGIIAAAADNTEGIVGVASPAVKVMHMMIFGYTTPITACSEGASGETARLEEGIRYAADNGAQVINLSWGARGYSSTTLAAIQYAISKGAVVATAAANYAEEITVENPWFPAVYAKDLKGLISVAATDSNPANGSPKCAFSNVSKEYVEIAAPGCDTTVANSTYGLNGILSTLRVSTHQGYGYMPGTSMATPHIAAAAGLVFAVQWKKQIRPTPAQVEDLLIAGSRSQENLNDYVVGGKHLDLDLLMKSFDEGGVEVPPPPPSCEN